MRFDFRIYLHVRFSRRELCKSHSTNWKAFLTTTGLTKFNPPYKVGHASSYSKHLKMQMLSYFYWYQLLVASYAPQTRRSWSHWNASWCKLLMFADGFYCSSYWTSDSSGDHDACVAVWPKNQQLSGREISCTKVGWSNNLNWSSNHHGFIHGQSHPYRKWTIHPATCQRCCLSAWCSSWSYVKCHPN